jgi:hypothetical protein
MDTKVFIDKVRATETYYGSEDYKKDIAALSDDDKIAVTRDITKALSDDADAEFARKQALKKDAQRVEDQNGKGQNEIVERFKSDQFEKAKQKFFSDPKFTVKDEAEKTLILEEFKKVSSGSIDADLIFKDLKRAFALVKSDDLLASRDEADELKKNASNFNASMANAAGGGMGGKDDDKYSKIAKELFMELSKKGFKITLDRAEEMVKSGTDWKSRDLSK